MKFLFWNARGVGNKRTQQQIWFTKNKEKLDFMVILEPMVAFNSALFCKKFGFDTCIGNCSNKIWLFFNNNLTVSVISDDCQALHCELSSPLIPLPFLVTCIYAKCTRQERIPLWDLLRSYSSISSPWIVGGDFITISSSNEREGGAEPDHNSMNDFNSAIQDCSLLDPGFTGHPFTWHGPGISQRLDRCLVNQSWLTALPLITISHGIKRHSDHRHLLVFCSPNTSKPKSCFRFQNMWTAHEDFKKQVETNWQYPHFSTPRYEKVC